MSSDLNTALYDRLAGVEVMTGRFLTAQQFLGTTLGEDPDTEEPAVYKGNLNTTPIVLDAQSVRKPVITFRPSGGLPDLRFRDDLIVDDVLYDLEIWTFSTLANLATDIGKAVQTLIERRGGCPALPTASGESVWAEAMVLGAEMFDSQRNGWFLLARYKFIEARN